MEVCHYFVVCDCALGRGYVIIVVTFTLGVPAKPAVSGLSAVWPSVIFPQHPAPATCSTREEATQVRCVRGCVVTSCTMSIA